MHRFDLGSWIGRYCFQFDESVRDYWRLRFEALGLSEAATRAALDEVAAEADSAVIELFADGTVASSALGRQFYRVGVELLGERLRFRKPDGALVELKLSADGLEAQEPGKPLLRFRRS